MVALAFNALLFDSQATPDPLPEPTNDGFPPDCGLSNDDKAFYMGLFSDFLGRTLDTPTLVLEHVKKLNEHRTAQAAQAAEAKKQDPVERARIATERSARATVVNQAAEEWRQAVAQRDAAMAQWEVYVKEKRDRYRALKNGGEA